MELLAIATQIVIALGIYNVWLLRRDRATAWRGGVAKSLREEFRVYGLPDWFMALVGVLKVTFATMLLIGIWFPWLVTPAALGLSVLMLGALAMHAKVHDPLKRSLPAATVLALCLFAAAVQVSTTAPDARSNQGATVAAASTP